LVQVFKTSAFVQLSLSSRGPVWLKPSHAAEGEKEEWSFARNWAQEGELYNVNQRKRGAVVEG
jgi:hypothetical protein